MDRSQAARVLGVGEGATVAEVRQAYLRLIGLHHPDRAGSGATGEATTINLAYAVMRRPTPVAEPVAAPSNPPPPPPPPEPRRVSPGVGVTGDDDTLSIDLPPDEAFFAVLEAGHQLGEITYVDRSNGLIEIVVEFLEAPTSSVVVTFQGRLDHTDAFCTIESLTGDPPPAIGDVVSLLAAAIRFS